jgi:peptide/nickel transport system permease protein
VLRYIAQRIVLFVLVMFVASAGCFYLIHLLPGNLDATLLGFGDTPQNAADLNARLGLDKPEYLQYFIWIGNALRGNLGISYTSQQSVSGLITSSLPIDLELIALSQALALLFAIPLAMRAARKPGGLFDRIATTTSFVLLSLPTFVVIVFLQLLLSVKFHLKYAAPSVYDPLGGFANHFYSLLMPAFAIAIGGFVVYYRVLRSEMMLTYYEDFITMARSKGLSRRRIVWRHAFRPSSIPLVTTVGLTAAGSVGGLFIVEFLTGLPGLGYELLLHINYVDYITVQGILLVVTTLFVGVLFLVDILFGFIDPRIIRE